MPALVALPAVPALTCPPAAGALGGAGLGPICSAVSGVAGAAGSAASQVAGVGVDSVLGAVGGWVTQGAVWLLGQIGGVLAGTTSVDLGAPWFVSHYETMAALAGVVVLPLLLLGIVQAVYRQSASSLLRSVLVHTPLALLLTAVAVTLVQLGLTVTDAMCAAVAGGAGLDAGHFLSSVVDALSSSAAAGQPGVPTFVVFLGAIAVVAGAVMVWIELLIRSAAVYVAVLFLPLALASLAWASISHWCRRLVDTLVALILAKFVIVAVLSLAAGALAAGVGSVPSGASSQGGGFASVLAGAALLLLAALAPWALFRLIPFVEAGAAGHLEGLGQRARTRAAAPVKGLAAVAMRASMAGQITGQVGRQAAGAGTAGIGVAGAAGGVSGGPSDSRGTSAARGSSVGSGGVGTRRNPGDGIPMWEPHPGSTAVYRRWLEEQDPADDPVPAASRTGDPDPASVLRPLPRQSGALAPDALGRDALGPRLVAARQSPDPPAR